MMDTATLAQQICMLGLATEAEVHDCRSDPSCNRNDANSLLKIMQAKGYLTPWQSQKLVRGDTDGYYMGGYRLLYLISQGTFGRVFRADDPKSGLVVAVKVLRQRWSENAQSVALFEREGKLGLSLQHTNIVQTLAVDRDQTTRQYYLVMEFVEGGNLRDFLAIRKKLKAAEALRVVEESAAGLAYAATKGMTHRDIKLTNILMSSEGSAKLVDFGLAGMEAVVNVEDDKVERTVDYAALEKATGVRSGDARSDIFFLGCVLYQLLSGRPPIEPIKERQQQMRLRQRYQEIPPLSGEQVQATPATFRLVEKMMAFDPEERFQTAAQVRDAAKLVRNEMSGKPEARAGQAQTVFVVEQNEKLQDAIREKFKELGFRVLIAGDPHKAMMRFQHQPYDGAIIDAGSVGEDGLVVFRQLFEEADRLRHPFVGVLILSQDQSDWTDRIIRKPQMAFLVRPVTLRQLYSSLCDLLNAQEG